MELKKYIKKSYNKKITIRLKDMQNFFSDKKSVNLKLKGNPIIYEVLRKKAGDTEYSLTTIKPGKIGKEHFMTRGHYHKNNFTELYLLLKGKGVLLIQNKKCIAIKLKKDKIYLISSKYAHRTINTGGDALEILTIQSTKIKYDYKKIEKAGFKKKV